MWTGKHIWIIGASTGIGNEVARRLAFRGAHIAVSARKADELRELVKDLMGTNHHALPVDVTDYASLIRARDTLMGNWGKIDAVIFAAGVYTAMRAANMNLEKAQQMIDINLKGALNVVSAVTPQLIAQKNGLLVMVASVAGYVGLPNGLGYGASKAALINLTETLYSDLKPYGVDVKLVCPGFVKTPLTAQNEFPMPFLLEVGDAAERIIRGMESSRFEIHFPWQLSRALKLLGILPFKLAYPLIRKATGL